MRILGIDYGSRRIGLAITDELGIMAHGRGIIEGGDDTKAITRITEIVTEDSVGQVVIGLPKNMNDTIGMQAKKVLKFAEQIRSQLSVPVITWDERLSTFQAEELLRDAQLSRKKKRRQLNTVAAQLILESYLEEIRSDERKEP